MSSAEIPLSAEYEIARSNTLIAIKHAESICTWIFVGVGLCILSVGMAYGLAGNTSGEFFRLSLRSIATSTVAAFAASTLGYALGFLFGIPRLLQKPIEKSQGGAENKGSPQKFFVTNTSLEEISDWLTKIVIGLGLVQFRSILHYLFNASVYLASFTSGDPVNMSSDATTVGGNLAVAFFFCLVVGCILLSLLLGYLQTRTRLTLMFLGVEAVSLGGAARVSQDAMMRPIAQSDESRISDTAPVKSVLRDLTDDDRKLLAVPREQLKTSTDIAGWASAWARSGGSTQVSEDALRTALQQDPTNSQILLRLAEVRKLNSNYQGYVNTVLELTKLPSANKQEVYTLAKGALLDALYLPPPMGFENAIQLSNYLSDASSEDEPMIKVWRAAAFGQKYSLIVDKGSQDALNARAEALKAVERVVQLVPDKNQTPRKVLRQIFDPSKGGTPRDNDLEVFKDDKDFVRLIMGESGT